MVIKPIFINYWRYHALAVFDTHPQAVQIGGELI